MGEILFLCHRMPYPPNKGDKIRSYHWLRELAAHHTVHLGTFIDDDADWAHRRTLDALCDRQCYRPLPAKRARLRSLRGLIDGEPLTFAFYRDKAMQQFVDRMFAERPIEAVLVFSSGMAPYVTDHAGVRRVLDFVDVDSDKWRQYADNAKPGPMRWVHGREARTLAAAEYAMAARFDASVFVSEAEADFFRRDAAGIAERVHAIANGVDAEYFDPATSTPIANSGTADIVFTGAMDYGANEDAVAWFVSNVWPGVRREVPAARFHIVGARPTRGVQALAREPGVEVTGTVDDVRPYLAGARVAIAPMRIARGIQNKVLEALAMACPVVMTPQAAEGLDTMDAGFVDIVAEPEAFAAAVVKRLNDPVRQQEAARAYVLGHYGWAAKAGELRRLLAADAPAAEEG